MSEKKDDNTQDSTNIWDEEAGTIDFFGELETISKDNPNIKANFDFDEVEKKDPTEEEEKVEEQEEETEGEKIEEEEVVLFEDEKKTSSGQNSEEKNSQRFSTATKLKELGLIDYELEEDEEIDEEALLKTSFEKATMDRMAEMFQELPDSLRAANKYVLNGGTYEEFLKLVDKNPLALEDMDIDDVEVQRSIVKADLLAEGHDEDYIKDQLEFFESKDKLYDIASKKYKQKKAEKESFLKNQEEARKRAEVEEKERIKTTRTLIRDIVTKNEEINGVPISPKDKDALPKYMTNRNIKVGQGSYITPMQRDLQRILSSEIGAVQLAKILNHMKEDGSIDFDFIDRKVKSRVVKESLDKSIKSIKKDKGDDTRKSLADLF